MNTDAPPEIVAVTSPAGLEWDECGDCGEELMEQVSAFGEGWWTVCGACGARWWCGDFVDWEG